MNLKNELKDLYNIFLDFFYCLWGVLKEDSKPLSKATKEEREKGKILIGSSIVGQFSNLFIKN